MRTPRQRLRDHGRRQAARRRLLETSLGAAYAPIALDRTGRVFALNNGHLSVLGHK